MTNAQLVFVNNNNEVVTDSLTVAEVFGKRHDNVFRDIVNIIESMKEIGEKGVQYFEETPYQHEQNKQWYPKFNLTKEGFTMLVMGFTGKKALEFKLKYISEFNKMEEYIKSQQQEQPKTAIGEIQQLLMRGAIELNERVDVLETKIETKITIDYQQQRIMQNTVEATVRHLWNNGTSHGRFTKRQLFSKAHRRLKDRYGVASYKDILEKDFEEAINYMRNWKGE
ncbi:transcriptional regulator [Bacillus thuringiensis]|uniref:Rha family phage regulatory protein n=1 Tax=Bacillus cereus VD196 TaxID=1053243 RepID=A0A9W5Q7C0_BACCE|nr:MULTISPECIES: Rha family transcriptional regulator [Bacillus cereus group]MDA2127896.1 Rha family transcriptional regulator [Bacillus cereus]EOO68946.1 rha family phage regulatory protein [Bacillus cereus VD196]MEB8551234.1 Rha family transcriptional regulator [Bacillus cereus]MEB8727627.1 Rha family transcriptional regulator [Bacillus cereus]OTX34673.1 transcriptional regulator [Bacillus thuringiensis serovar andalousiensis]